MLHYNSSLDLYHHGSEENLIIRNCVAVFDLPSGNVKQARPATGSLPSGPSNAEMVSAAKMKTTKGRSWYLSSIDPKITWVQATKEETEKEDKDKGIFEQTQV